jgi:hypothetical protein
MYETMNMDRHRSKPFRNENLAQLVSDMNTWLDFKETVFSGFKILETHMFQKGPFYEGVIFYKWHGHREDLPDILWYAGYSDGPDIDKPVAKEFFGGYCRVKPDLIEKKY